MASMTRASRAEAAISVARGLLGAGITDPVVLSGGSHIHVHLAPLPVVARVSSYSSGTDAEYWRSAWEREVAVAAHLASEGVPSIRPTDLAPPGPHAVSDGWMTLWAHVALTPGHPATVADYDRGLSEIQRALATFEQALPRFSPWRAAGAALRALYDMGCTDRGELPALARAYAQLDEQLDIAGSDDLVPAHGDATPGNLLWAADRWVWLDFEDVCLAPRHWDLACLVSWTSMYGWRPEVSSALVDLRLGEADPAERAAFDLALTARLVYLGICVLWMALRGGYPSEEFADQQLALAAREVRVLGFG